MSTKILCNKKPKQKDSCTEPGHRVTMPEMYPVQSDASCTFMENPLRFLYISQSSQPGDGTDVCMQSIAAKTPGKPDLL